MALHEWLLFVAIWTAAGLPLGPNALNCISTVITEGYWRALWSIAGILLAATCHMAATILGVATVLLANAALFQAIKLAGAAYLIWMGLALWRKKDAGISIEARPRATSVHLVGRSWLISMTNPKAILAYLAVFSQFIRPDVALASQLATLVPTALVITGLVYLGYITLGLGVGRLLRTARRRLAFNRAVGSFYIAAGIGLAVAESPSAAVPRP